MRILGIDPGSRFTGFGIIEVSGDRVTPLHQGVIKTGAGVFPERLGIIFNGIRELVEEFSPDEAAVETVFISKNANSALKLGQARGAAICAVVSMGIPVAEYSPRSVKQAIVGRGGADKVQIQHMITVLLQLKEKPAEDAADALAVALCHQHTQQTAQRMQARQTR
ncbi:MAG: crossover junction endodeoxyribonuclease RuvC [Xanthomonadales bacterium]|nr:crossover junction endodeoxyribonuclease RuvC [Gammaproteobacteria bacterium]MBT8053679.1 crossover junction endodeoxyribonuclease RuvC [Gammaproteobacteria bacterium]NND57066.1 crossover junction endodeoxyribonuclease RuvC [Xanthomonadales bacterium]NNK51852.1 crossover junction endodeoxyribonuclease RuvC [Xanthomonadales bacterium]NNL95875.1 crossover junction endodeoxyribonuclease RuvC [Xanthomonadales bacterium]